MRNTKFGDLAVIKGFGKLLALAMLLLAGQFGQAQTPGKVGDLELLNNSQLANEPWYYDLDSALANPEKVYKLSLQGKKYKYLPEEFGQLTNLQLLNLSDCGLKELPLEIKECKKLQMISLFNNKLRYLPAEMHELKQLEILYLANNKLFEMPRWFATMGQIRRLDISRNRLTPAEVSAAKKMLPRAEVTY